ncbi:MAG: GDP-mannose-dependent alpha-(1-6)-phosphatidylinositol monomannoside mannosyltransferase [Bacteroidetes bacterium ADurb.Bin302]|jgi:phosphatidylinositol alpha-1,6-mannosyltransferase|nr:MAG: GDP-mannose-dependent alpha-(1-6)-phosphatidylinositol monomannoside mannosyltransferase [Bacteroidetes bacterium ADurb.Bin302]
MKRLVLLSYDYPPNNGGIARLCGGIVRELKGRSYPYLVVTNVRSDHSDSDNVVRISGKRGILEWRILKFLRNNTTNDDIVLCDTWHPAGFLSLLSGRDTYILCHGAELMSGKGFFKKHIKPVYRKWVLNHCKGAIANSQYTERLISSLDKNIRSTTIALPVDSKLFHPTKTKNTTDNILRVCTISRIEKFKGHDFVLKTIASLPKTYQSRINLTIGGKGPYLEELKQLTEMLNLNSIVQFKGFVPEQELCDFYSSNDIFILCTREEPNNHHVEGFGLVFVEAQACGTATIGTNAGGIPSAISDGNGGWLIEQDSSSKLMTLLKKLIDDKEYAQSQGAVARLRVLKECSWAEYMEKLFAFIKTY